MKSFLVFTILIGLSSLPSFGVSIPLPDIPVPEISATHAIAIAQKEIKNDSAYLLVGVQWSLASSFTPPVSDGGGYDHLGKDPDGYAWFVTYVYKIDALEKEVQMLEKKVGQRLTHEKYNSILVIKVRGDGSTMRIVGIRT